MKWRKKVLSVSIVLVLAVALFSTHAMAQKNPAVRLAEIDSEIEALEAQLDQLSEQTKKNGANEILFAGARIIQTSPQFIVEEGFSIESLIGAGTQYYVIQNPDKGEILLGSYWGMHSKGGRVTIQLGNNTYSATVAGLLPPAIEEIYNKVGEINKQIDQLKTERTSLAEQVQTLWNTYRNCLDKYREQDKPGLVFQIGNPAFLVDGYVQSIEVNNIFAVPSITSGHTLIPIRALVEGLGGSVTWNQATRSTDCTLNDVTVTLKVGSDQAIVDGTTVRITTPVIVQNGKTMVPLRFVSEQFGAHVEWLSEDKIILVGFDLTETPDEEKMTPMQWFESQRTTSDTGETSSTGAIIFNQNDYGQAGLGAQYRYSSDFVVNIMPEGFSNTARTFTFGDAGGFYIEAFNGVNEGTPEEFAAKYHLTRVTPENWNSLSDYAFLASDDSALFLLNGSGDKQAPVFYYYNGYASCVLAPWFNMNCSEAQQQTILTEFYRTLQSFGMVIYSTERLMTFDAKMAALLLGEQLQIANRCR